jgi:uncharacterized protein YegP (UPF0339 family)
MPRPKYKFEIYRDKSNLWRWRFTYLRRIMADSGEGYDSKSKAVRAARRLMKVMWMSNEFEVGLSKEVKS